MTADLIGWRVLRGHFRRHIATVRKVGPAAYSVRSFCSGMSHTLVSDKAPEVLMLEDNELHAVALRSNACPRCAASYKRRMWGAA